MVTGKNWEEMFERLGHLLGACGSEGNPSLKHSEAMVFCRLASMHVSAGGYFWFREVAVTDGSHLTGNGVELRQTVILNNCCTFCLCAICGGFSAV